ncbi:phosphoribosyltransferase [Sulfurovum sp. XGS-02]|uniref:phosphoribosyltransferase n=1 Tax=Sulfurovum sp. XGS-02 TaxID=2925411 RepID=UPI0020672811|nr:phosphoribosyltransferase family protein [Sulfurovum sp. XGS-02]UPT76600.1 phosphoribosyltransferase [Sulfurovum sp. XGS-02]
MFKDRKDAGQKLAAALQRYKVEDPLVFAIPRGGVELGYEVSKALNSDFSLLICRKLPFPDNTESGFGAIAEDGSLYINASAASSVSEKEIEQIIAEQSLEIKRRIQTLREGKPHPTIKGRTVILVDDGIAMGSTMHVAVELCKKAKAKKIIVAAPVAGRQTIEKFSKIVDGVIVLESPVPFYAVAQVYENWYDVNDNEVLRFFKTQDNS